MVEIIKYVSADGLHCFEARGSANHLYERLHRLIVLPLTNGAPTATLGAGLTTNIHKRYYLLRETYIDPESGNRIFEYREEL